MKPFTCLRSRWSTWLPKKIGAIFYESREYREWERMRQDQVRRAEQAHAAATAAVPAQHECW